MRKLPLCLVAVSAAAALAFTSAAPSDLLSDELGDGNAINGQGFGGLTGQNPSQNTAPATLNADLVNLQAATLYEETTVTVDGNETTENVVRGLQLRLGTAGEPTASDVPTITRIQTVIDGCTTWFQLYAGTNGQQASNVANVRILDGCGLGVDAAGLSNRKTLPAGPWLKMAWDAETSQTVLDIDFASLPAELAPYLGDGSFIDVLGAAVRVNTGVVTAPVVDEMLPDGWAEFTVGDDVPAS